LKFDFRQQLSRRHEMPREIAKMALVLIGIIFTASTAFAQTTNTNCTATSAGGSSTDVNCTSTTTPTGPTPAQVEQQKELNENMSKIGASLGAIVAQKRARHAQEKNDLVAVVYCRQNPTGSWTFSGKAPMPCPIVEKNLVAYCTVNSKTALCKDVAKLPAPASAPVVAVHEVQPQPVPQQAPAMAQPVQNVVASQPQPQQTSATTPTAQNVVSQPQPQTQMVSVTVTPALPEVSVAEAARRNKAAKEAQQAKENPKPEGQPQPQQ
jgi:hypothetical protein